MAAQPVQSSGGGGVQPGGRAASGRGLSRLVGAVAFRTCPALLACLWFALGSLPILIPQLGGAPAPLVLAVVVVVGAGLAVVSVPRARRYALWAGVGAGLAAVHAWAPWQTYRRCLARAECAVEIRGTATAATYQGDSLPWLAPERQVTCSLAAIRLQGQAEWRACRGTVLVRLPTGVSPRYGDRLRAAGELARPGPGLFAGDFDYRRHLLCEGIRHVLYAQECHITGHAAGWRRAPAWLFDLRDRCAERLVAGIDGESEARLLPPMVLGYRQGLDAETRARFLRSGTIHIFAISGLNVAIFGAACLAVLRLLRVPFQGRYLVLPALLGAYVVMTGAEASSLRAWVMGSVWAVAKGLLLPVAPVNLMATAALLLLLAHPFYVGQVGFQFSFLIVSVLVAGWPLLQQGVALLEERDRWLPLCGRRGTWRRTWRRQAVLVGGGSLLAWLAGAGLVASVNGLMIPAGVVVNMAVSFLAWLLLLLSGGKLVTAGVPGLGWADTGLAATFEVLLRGTNAVADLGSRPPASFVIRPPALAVVLLYHVCLFACLLPGLPRRTRVAAALGVCGLLLAMAATGPGARATVAVLAPSGSAPPAVAVIRGAPLPPVVLNAPNPETCRSLVTWLIRHGYGQVDALVVAGGRDLTSAATTDFLATVPTATVVSGEGIRRGAAPTPTAVRTDGRLARVRRLPPRPPGTGDGRPTGLVWGDVAVEWTQLGLAQTLSVRFADDPEVACVSVHTDLQSGRLIDVWWRGGRRDQVRLPISLRPSLAELRAPAGP